ncbi:CBS domain-containing protein [uncultured Litoreibacter sp.]|uniref:CBS domain-containing protein n=1 Tax=uncultured Litoreibacter sp. TaxID=1392394 RepID=UPI00261CAF81|nr:CBS domain-containing protein [uncultured Litoreibacter sp.]
MRVSQILQAKPEGGVVTIAPDATVSDAANLLSTKRIGSVVVTPDGKHAMGILSERDIVREIGKRGPGCLDDAVSAMMTRDPVTCSVDDTADEVLSRMTEGRFRHMPVVKDGDMIGLITIGDVVKSRLNELAMEKDALEGMIMGH